MRILIVGSQHGDEYSGERLYRHIESNHPELLEYVNFMIANPKARKLRTRYIESDLNRSYSLSEDTYECRRAAKILEHIDTENYDLVLDMHTTTVDQPPCVIVSEINDRNEPFLRATSFDHIVEMGTLADHTLAGNCPQSVAIEIHEHIPEDLLESICWDIERYILGHASDSEKYVYRDTKQLKKSELSADELKKLRNFEVCGSGYYPIMIGENSYKKFTDYVGFKSYKRYNFKV